MSTAPQSNFANFASRSRRNARTLQAYMALQNQAIAERITQLRQQRGNPPQPVVAAAIGISLRAYQDWEAGATKPRYLNLERLAEYYGVTEDYILTGSGDGHTAPPSSETMLRDLLDAQSAVLEEIKTNQEDIKRALEALPAVAHALTALLRELEAGRRPGRQAGGEG